MMKRYEARFYAKYADVRNLRNQLRKAEIDILFWQALAEKRLKLIVERGEGDE